MTYYNENDPKAAAWLRELITAGHIAHGVVDERSIADVTPGDLRGYTQCHFFAGIGGWSLALRLAGWADTRPVWTGSCPCQPYSNAGKGDGDADPRNLWPVLFNLIRKCRPVVCFGEQVESAVGHGWLDGISTDLEGEGYASGAAVLGAHSVGAPHIRQRLYWVGVANGTGRNEGKPSTAPTGYGHSIEPASCTCGMGHAGCQCNEFERRIGNLGCATGQEQGEAWQRQWSRDAAANSGSNRDGLDDANCWRQQDEGEQCGNGGKEAKQRQAGELRSGGAWGHYELIPCRDGKARRIESGTFPLAYGVSGRVGLLRGYGNAIVPQVAAEFIKAFDYVV